MKAAGEKPIKNFLKDFGLTDKEIIVYMTLLKSGPNTIMNLARETDIKRSTTHNTVEELIKKGLVSQTNYGERRMVVAEDPDKLRFLMDQKRWDINKLEKSLPDIITAIYEAVPSAKENTKVDVKYYQGEKGFIEVCQRSLDYADKEILSICNYEEWSKVYSLDYDREYYFPKRMEKKLPLKLLTFENELTRDLTRKDKSSDRITRFLDPATNFKTTIFIYGKEVSIMVSSEPYTAIVIENQEIYNSFEGLFQILWRHAEASK